MIEAANTREELQREFNFITGVHTGDDIIEFLNTGVKPLVEVIFTKNKISMISVTLSADRKLVKVRMHEEFLKAPFEIFDALRKYINTGRRSYWKKVGDYAGDIPASSRESTRNKKLVTSGEIYDLKKILHEVKKEFFTGRIACRITWGRERVSNKRRRRSVSLRLGSWDSVARIIRIHPLLDDKRVPRDFLKYIVFHELLHAVVPGTVIKKRRYDHSPEFRKIEKSFPQYKEMKQLSKKLLDVLV